MTVMDPVEDHDVERLGRRIAVLQAITKAQHAYIANDETSALFGTMLDDLLGVAESEYGAIGEVLYKEDGTPYFKSHAVTNIAWDEATRQLYEQNVETGLEFHNLQTLFGAVMTTGEVVITNSPGTDPRRGGLPPGHPPLDAFLGAPFFHSGVMIGMVLLANRPQGYDAQLLEDIGPFLTTCAGIIESHRAERRRVEHERALRAAKEAAEVANRAKSAFLTNVTHELRTPLTAIIGFARALGRNSAEALGPRELQLVDRIGDRGVHLLSLVDDVLLVSRAETGELSFSLSTVDLVALVGQVVDQCRASLHDAKIELCTELPAGPVWLTTDPERMGQILRGLLGNAIKFTPRGHVRVRLGVNRRGEARYLEVEDTGIGIAREDHREIVQPFVQVDEGTRRRYGGAGLGLTVTHWLVEGLGYRLSIDSTLGEGSTFRVDFE